MLSPSLYLLLMLLAAAVLGGVLGYAWARLRSHSRWLAVLSATEQKHVAAQQQSASQIDALEVSLAKERDGSERVLSRWQRRESAHKTRQDVLESHALSQTKRINALLAERHSAEERQVRLERRVAALKHELNTAARDRAFVQPSTSASARARETRAGADSGEADVPLLIQRADVASELFLEGEIPVLSESDLPESLDISELEGVVSEA